MFQNINFFRVLKTGFSIQQYKTLATISIIYSLSCTTQMSFPILFKEAKLLCSNSLNPDQKYNCYEYQICENKIDYIIDKENGPKSLISQFNLICENKNLHRTSLSIVFSISLLAVFVNILMVMGPQKRKSFYSLCGILVGSSLLLSVYFSNDLLLISIFLGFANFGYILILTYSFLLINDLFEEEANKVGFGILHILWGLIGVLYSLIAFVSNSNWILLNTITGIPLIFSSIILILIDEDSDVDLIIPNTSHLKNKKKSNFQLIREAMSISDVRTNYIVFIFYWFTQIITYIGLPIELESIGGNLYLNLALFAILETIGSFLASELALKYDFLKTMKIFINLTIFFLILFIFAPPYLQNEDDLKIIGFTIATLCVKLSYDTTWHLVGMHLPKLFTEIFYAQYLILAVTISRFSLIFLPYINYSARFGGFHPFLLYGIFWIICRILMNFVKLFNLKREYNMSESCFLEIQTGAYIDPFYDKNISPTNIIKRENKLNKYIELNELLLKKEKSNEPKFVNNIDEVMGEKRRTLIFQEINSDQNDVTKVKFSKFKEKFDKEKRLPMISRNNINNHNFKRRFSTLDVCQLIQEENQLDIEKKQLYGNESPILKEKILDFIEEGSI